MPRDKKDKFETFSNNGQTVVIAEGFGGIMEALPVPTNAPAQDNSADIAGTGKAPEAITPSATILVYEPGKSGA